MRKTYRLSGLGGRKTDDLIRGVAAAEGGAVCEEEGGLRVVLADGRADEVIARMPASQEQWQSRLKWVEKQAAVILLGQAFAYTLALPGRSHGGRGRLRLSVVLSLSTGPPLARRFVVTHERGAKRATVSIGGSLPRYRGARGAFVSSLPDWVDSALGLLASGVTAACEEFQLRGDVQEALAVIAEKRQTELRYVDHLYGVEGRHNERLYGLAVDGLAGSRAIEAERRRLQQGVLDRYAVCIRARILSLGIITG